MSAHVLLNLLNELGKSDRMRACRAFYRFFATTEMRGLPSMLSLFRNVFNKFNNTGERMLDSIHHITLNYSKSHFRNENVYATLLRASLQYATNL